MANAKRTIIILLIGLLVFSIIVSILRVKFTKKCKAKKRALKTGGSPYYEQQLLALSTQEKFGKQLENLSYKTKFEDLIKHEYWGIMLNYYIQQTSNLICKRLYGINAFVTDVENSKKDLILICDQSKLMDNEYLCIINEKFVFLFNKSGLEKQKSNLDSDSKIFYSSIVLKLSLLPRLFYN